MVSELRIIPRIQLNRVNFIAFAAVCLFVTSGTALDWDYFVLTLYWPPTICKNLNTSCSARHIEKNWTIHGLWPTSYKDPEVHCGGGSGPDFDVDELDPIVKSLLLNWPSMSSKEPRHVWQYEWKKHGRCLNTSLFPQDELKYFNETLNLKAKYDYIRILNASGYNPSDTQKYEVPSLIAALHKGLGKFVYLTCDSLKVNGQREHFLAELRICYSKTLEMIDCPSASHLAPSPYNNVGTFVCSKLIFWPQFLKTEKETYL